VPLSLFVTSYQGEPGDRRGKVEPDGRYPNFKDNVSRIPLSFLRSTIIDPDQWVKLENVLSVSKFPIRQIRQPRWSNPDRHPRLGSPGHRLPHLLRSRLRRGRPGSSPTSKNAASPPSPSTAFCLPPQSSTTPPAPQGNVTHISPSFEIALHYSWKPVGTPRPGHCL
jgi:hypothetical protein